MSEEETIAWEDYHPEPVREIVDRQTNITCPKCGKRLYKRLDMILTSNPPQHIYECHNCNWRGFNY